jgi:hypothetical protein
MKNDSCSRLAAEVEVAKVKLSKCVDLGIDFSNQIDAWKRMEFKFHHQIQHLKRSREILEHAPVGKAALTSLVYAVRVRIDENT